MSIKIVTDLNNKQTVGTLYGCTADTLKTVLKRLGLKTEKDIMCVEKLLMNYQYQGTVQCHSNDTFDVST